MLFLALDISNEEANNLLGGLRALQDASGEVITTAAAKVTKYESGSAEMRQAVEEEEYATKLFAVTGRLIHSLVQHQAKLSKPVYKKIGEVIRSPRRPS